MFGRDLVFLVDLIIQTRKFSYADSRDYVENLESRLQEAFELVKLIFEESRKTGKILG